MKYYAKPAPLDKKDNNKYKMSCEEHWANYKTNYSKCDKINYKHSMVSIQIKNYALVLTTLSVNYYMQVQDYILPQTEELQEHYLRVAPYVHHEVMEDYWQVHQADQAQGLDMAKDYLQDKLAVSNYRRPRTLQAPTAWTSGATSASN